MWVCSSELCRVRGRHFLMQRDAKRGYSRWTHEVMCCDIYKTYLRNLMFFHYYGQSRNPQIEVVFSILTEYWVVIFWSGHMSDHRHARTSMRTHAHSSLAQVQITRTCDVWYGMFAPTSTNSSALRAGLIVHKLTSSEHIRTYKKFF